ncbi:hypothetical protein ID866_1513 [Astraeus odoratus]|nr:hypothetical protein ID866_1513 [Astraeus odoratus]
MASKVSEKNNAYSDPSVDAAEYFSPPEHGKLHRQLKNRHIAMISIGGVIGTGLFVGTGTALSNGGPLGLLLGYITMGTIVFAVMVSLGEMVAFLPIPGGHIKLADRFVNRAFSFAMGWNYWYNWTIIAPAELSAAALLIDYWHPNVDNSLWVALCIIVVVTINMLGAGAYGEAEFIFASIKVLTITGLIILGIILDLGGGPNHDRIGFRYWKNPGPFVQYDGIAGAKGRFLGWWAVMTQAAFSFIGTEIVAIINACLLSSAWSAASSDLYTSSRALYGLAAAGNAPKCFLKTSKSGLPYISVIFCALFTLLAFMAASSGAGNVFTWLANMTSIAGLMTWFGIAVTYLRFYKGLRAHGIDRRTLPFYTRVQPYAAWYACISTFVICFFSGWSVFLKGNWDTATFVTNYLPFALFPVLYVGALCYYRTSPVKAQDMDFESDLAQIAADEVEDPPPKNKIEAFWRWLM